MTNSINKAKCIVQSLGRMAVRTIITIANSLSIGLPDLLLGFLAWPRKHLRLHVCILSTEKEQDITLPLDTEQLIHRAIETTKNFYQKFFNISIHPYQKTYIHIIQEPAPVEALDFDCSLCSELGIAGQYLVKHVAGWHFLPISMTFPVTVFVIDNFKNTTIGCSMSVLSDYVIIDRKGLISNMTLAHEIGHACGLWHSRTPANFMYKCAPEEGKAPNWYQKCLVRSSRHVQYW